MASIVSLFIVLSFTGCTKENIEDSSIDVNIFIENSMITTVESGTDQEDDSKGNGDD